MKFCEEDVHQLFEKQKAGKAPGPDGVSCSCLKACNDQVTPVFKKTFNRLLELCGVPTYFTIIPIPKKATITGLNDYKPVALISVVMKSFKRLVLTKAITNPLLNPCIPHTRPTGGPWTPLSKS